MRRLVLLVFLFLLLMAFPAYAAEKEWVDPSSVITPDAYGDREYVRTHWLRFYTNYGGIEWGYTGKTAVAVGGYYAPVFGYPQQPNTGYSAVAKSPNLDPAKSDPIPADVRNWLEGFLGSKINPGLNDRNYWLCSPAFLKGTVATPNGFAPSSWPISSYGSGMEQDVYVYVGSKLPNGSAPFVPGRHDVNYPMMISNYDTPTFIAGATNGEKTRYIWSTKAAADAAGTPPIGNVNLTEDLARYLMQKSFNMPAGSQTFTLSSGRVTASFPYNLFAWSVEKVDDQGESATYTWKIVNPTPLHLKNITVRVYTHGKKTNTWNLAAVYQNVDIPPASLGGGLAANVQNSDLTAVGMGTWGVVSPKTPTKVPKPTEDYDVIVTADVNLQISNGKLMGYSTDTGLRATYWHGATPKGLPSNEVPGTQLGNNSAAILGIRVADPFGDNIASVSDAGFAPAQVPGQQNNYEDNLAAISLEILDSKTGEPISTPGPGQTFDIKATFSSTFDFAGWARVRLFRYQTKYKTLTEEDEQRVYFKANETKTITWEDKVLGSAQEYWFIASIDYSNNSDDPNNNWTEELFDDKHDEATFEDNKLIQKLTGSDTASGPPSPQKRSYWVYYHPVKWQEIPVYEEVTEDIYGWVKIPFRREEIGDKAPGVRLIPDSERD